MHVLFNVRKLVAIFLMALVVGAPLFGLKKSGGQHTNRFCKTKSFNSQCEEKIIKLDSFIDKKLIEKKKEDQLSCEKDQLILSEEFVKIETAVKLVGSFADTKEDMFDSYEGGQKKADSLKGIASTLFSSQDVNSLDIHPVVSKKNVFYWIDWNDVPCWTDSVNSEKAKNCSMFHHQYTHGGIGNDDDRYVFMNDIQQHYKIHIMPKDEAEGKRVVALLLYLLKNSADFRKYAYTFKFLGSFSTGQKDTKKQPLPVFVIYSVWGKKNAQNLLNIIAKALKEASFVGSPVIPRYNFTVDMQGLTAAMGDADFKPNSLFDKTKNYSVCKSSEDQNQEPFELTLSSLK